MRRMDLAVLMTAAWLLGGCATTLRGTTDVLVVEGSAGMAGNILLGGLIGAVDAGSGAMFDLVPNPIKVNLVARAAPAGVSGTSWSAPPVAPRREFTPEDGGGCGTPNDGEFDETDWNYPYDPWDFAVDAVLRVSGGREVFVQEWQP